MSGWNVFTGVSRAEASKHACVKKMMRSKKPLYLAIDMHLTQNSGENGTYLHFVPCKVDVRTVPMTLASQVKGMKDFNDKAWVEGLRDVGTFDGLPIWKLELGS